MTSKKRKMIYPIICCIVYVIVIILEILGPYTGNNDDLAVFCIIYLIIILPVAMIACGALFYKLTNRIVLPNLLIFLFSGLASETSELFSCILGSYSWKAFFKYKLGGGCFMAGIIMAISLLSSLITMSIVKENKKNRDFKQRMKEEENSKNESDLMS